MVEIRQQSSIRNRPWIAGKVASRGVGPLALTGKRYESKQMLSNTAMQIDRPFITAGMANLITQESAVLSWQDLREAGLLEHLSILLSIGRPFDVCLFKQLYESFDGDGTTQTFYLRRRPADPVVSVEPGIFWAANEDYPVRVISYSDPYGTAGATSSDLTVALKDNSDIDTGDPGAGEVWIDAQGEDLGPLTVSRMRFGTAPDAKRDIFVVAYIPLFIMAPDGDNARSYQERLVESHTLKLVEVG